MEVIISNNTSYNILIIDDEKCILKFLITALSQKGYNIDTACNGEDGLKKNQNNSYDIILTDIKMPGISGNEVLIQAKRNKGDAFPVIGMSGTPWLLEHHLFDAVIAKPFTVQTLFKAINKVMSSY